MQGPALSLAPVDDTHGSLIARMAWMDGWTDGRTDGARTKPYTTCDEQVHSIDIIGWSFYFSCFVICCLDVVVVTFGVDQVRSV